MELLPFDSALERYEQQARELFDAHRAGDSAAIRILHQNHPRFLDAKIPWLPQRLADSEIRDTALDLADMQLTVARTYNFRDWAALNEYVQAVLQEGSPVARFESAVEAVVDGDLAGLQSLLKNEPGLVGARSTD